MITEIENHFDVRTNNDRILGSANDVIDKARSLRKDFVEQHSFFMFVRGANTEALRIFNEVKNLSDKVDTQEISEEEFEHKIFTLNIDNDIAYQVYMTECLKNVVSLVSELGQLSLGIEALRPDVVKLRDLALDRKINRHSYEEVEVEFNETLNAFHKLADALWLMCKEIHPLISAHTHDNEIDFDEMKTLLTIKTHEVLEMLRTHALKAAELIEKVKSFGY